MLLAHLCIYLAYVSFFFSFLWCWGSATTCDCGTSWTFILYFLHKYYDVKDKGMNTFFNSSQNATPEINSNIAAISDIPNCNRRKGLNLE